MIQMNEGISFINNFWDANDSGYDIISSRINHSITTLQELLDYYGQRVQIEKEYNKKLEKLNDITIGSFETGTLKQSLDKLRSENNEMLKFNHKFVKSVTQINYTKLNNFYSVYCKRTKKIMGHMNKLMNKKHEVAKDLDYTKQNYKETSSQIKSLRLTVQTTWGKELEKNEKKLNKLQSNLVNTERNYKIAIDNFNKINEIYKRDWLISLKEIHQLEVERIQMCKINCFNYCNNIATLCVDHDQSADVARSYFAKVVPPQDIQNFSNNYGTGNRMLTDVKFIDFMNGFNDGDNDKFEIADFDSPEYDHLLSRSYSTYSHATNTTNQTNQTRPMSEYSTSPSKYGDYNTPNKTQHQQHQQQEYNSPQFESPPSPTKYKPMASSPNKVSPLRIPPHDPIDLSSPIQQQTHPGQTSPTPTLQKLQLPKPEDTKSNTSNNSPDEKTDIFSVKSHKLNASNGSSNYSNPTNYSGSSERNWSSPRRKEKQFNQVQEKINLKSKELPQLNRSETNGTTNSKNNKVPVMKDFSIDFIAKALEDLNSGGNGDIEQYRKSVRLAKQYEQDYQLNNNHNYTPYKPISQDNNEVPTRYDTISFNQPRSDVNGSPMKASVRSPERRGNGAMRPKSMYDSFNFSTANGSSPPKRSLLKTSSKSYTNLNSMINAKITPMSRKPYVTKAKAKYTYRPQHQGELMIKKHWNMYIMHKQQDFWFLCELADNCEDLAGAVGLVPGNYIVEGDDLF